MSYDLDWLDEEQRVLGVRLFDPIDDLTIESLGVELLPELQEPHPIFILLDLQHVRNFQALTELGSAFEESPWELDQMQQHQNSRVAMLGGGLLASLIVGLMKQITGEELIRAFQRESDALEWLREQTPD